MGQGDIGGNGSVTWTFVHHAAGGGIAALAHSPAAGPPGNNEVKVAGNRASAKDPINFANIGTRPGLVPGNFRVTLTTYTLDPRGMIAGSATAVYQVPAVDRSGGKNPVTPVNPIEIKIEW